MDQEKMLAEIKEMDVKNVAIVDVADIDFSEQVRKYCEMNSCGKFGANWACPPGVGPLNELRDKAQQYKQGMMVQTFHQLKNSFDLKGMMSAKELHEKVLRAAQALMQEKYGVKKTLLLGAGSCEVCSPCAYKEGEPCHFPDKALASMEAYGIDVMALVKKYNIPYHHGESTVSYVGLVLF